MKDDGCKGWMGVRGSGWLGWLFPVRHERSVRYCWCVQILGVRNSG